MSEPRSVLEQFPAYQVVIGIEVHVQLTTKSKIFCSCPNSADQEPNTAICQVCTGQPGVLPVLNKAVVDAAISAALATNSTINKVNYFARKHYFYPDLPKGYQITQADVPICQDGFVSITKENGESKNIRLMRIHMEEDAGKNIHAAHTGESFVDLNRAGTPLLEIVTYPDISSTEEARLYLKALRNIVMYLGISSGNMEEGAFRADTNISVKKKSDTAYGTRVELKNINSFKFIADAIEYEIERQITALESGQVIRQETRLWDTKDRKTFVMRTKEEAADYRYMIDPDLPELHLDDAWIESIKKTMPELPHEKVDRLQAQYGLSNYEADILINERDVAAYFEAAAGLVKNRRLLINWVLRDVMGYLKEKKLAIQACKVTPEKLAQLVDLIDAGVINARVAQEVFVEVADTGVQPREIVKERGLEQIGSSEELEKMVQEVLAASPENVAAYKAGKDKLFGAFVGQVMAKTKGKGNPQIIAELLKKNLA